MGKNLTTSHNPLITVVMPVRNGEKYIRKAVESILYQTFTDFELLILDDGSVDQTVAIVKSLKDKRIRLVQNEKPLNLAQARQRGVEEAKGKYIAFLDSDDIMHRQRLEKQLQFLRQNPQISVVGSWIEIIDRDGRSTRKIWKHPVDSYVVSCFLLFRNCLTQSAVMLRKECLVDNPFRSEYRYAPDFDLWTRLNLKFGICNLAEVLTYYRVHQENCSIKYAKAIKKCTMQIFTNNLKQLGFHPTDEEIEIHDSLERHRASFSTDRLDRIQSWLLKLISENYRKRLFPVKNFNQVAGDYWFKVCLASADQGGSIIKNFWSSSIRKKTRQHLLKYLLLIIYATFHKSRVIDVSSEDWRRITI